MPDGDAKKINVSFDETEKEFNETEKTLEDIIDEELANSEREPEFKEEPKEEPVEIPVEIKDEEEAEAPEIEEEPKAFEPTVSRVAVETNDAAGIDERPVRASRKKSGKGIIVFLIILIILIAGAFLAYYLLSTQTIKNDFFAGNDTKCETPAGPTEKKETPEVESDDAVVIKTVSGIKDKLMEKNPEMFNNSMVITYNDVIPVYKANDKGLLMPLVKSYGLFMPVGDSSGALVIETLAEMGFSEYAVGLLDQKYYINNDGIICGSVNEGDLTLRIGCASENWVSEKDEKLGKKLVEAFEKKEGSYPQLVSGKSDNIKQSIDSKYDSIIAGIDGAPAFFYRKSGDTNWIYITSTQDRPDCAKFDEDARAAFKGNGTCADFSADPDGNIVVEF